jgi:hypothetical protein
MRSANIDFTRKDKEGGEYQAPDCLSVRLHPRYTTWSCDVIQIADVIKNGGGYYKLLNPRECSIFHIESTICDRRYRRLIASWRFTI